MVTQKTIDTRRFLVGGFFSFTVSRDKLNFYDFLKKNKKNVYVVVG